MSSSLATSVWSDILANDVQSVFVHADKMNDDDVHDLRKILLAEGEVDLFWRSYECNKVADIVIRIFTFRTLRFLGLYN